MDNVLLKDKVFFKTLTQLPFVKRIILYGSRAREDNSERSDVDLAIDCPMASEKDWLTAVEVIDNADTLLKIDLVRYDQLAETNPLKQSIQQEGQILFVRQDAMENSVQLAFAKLENALGALGKIIEMPMMAERMNVDACIHRFEFTIELFWKLLKRILETKGLNTLYPKDVSREAYQGRLIDDETLWLQMLNDRNQTSHTYDESLADQIYQRIKIYFPVMEKTFIQLQEKYSQGKA